MKPNHSETFKKRQDNTDHQQKSLEDHIAHFKMRLKERYDVDLTTEQYYEILNEVIANSGHGNLVYKLNRNSSINETTIMGHKVWVVYGRQDTFKSNGTEVPARLKTVLIPNTTYLVPPSLGRQYDHTSFTQKVNNHIELVKKVATQVDDKVHKANTILKQLPVAYKPLVKLYRKDGVITNYYIKTIVNHLTGK